MAITRQDVEDARLMLETRMCLTTVIYLGKFLHQLIEEKFPLPPNPWEQPQLLNNTVLFAEDRLALTERTPSNEG